MLHRDWLCLQPTSALSEALASVIGAIAGDKLGLLSLLDAWAFADALQGELVARGGGAHSRCPCCGRPYDVDSGVR
jgi:hypothetical protein